MACLTTASSKSGLNSAAVSASAMSPLRADDPAAKNIYDDVEVEIAPFRRPHQFGDVP